MTMNNLNLSPDAITWNYEKLTVTITGTHAHPCAQLLAAYAALLLKANAHDERYGAMVLQVAKSDGSAVVWLDQFEGSAPDRLEKVLEAAVRILRVMAPITEALVVGSDI
jgi:hypothetical protein